MIRKAITQQEKKCWSRAKVLKESKRRWDALGINVPSQKMYRHLKRLFLHQDRYEMVRFDCVDNHILKAIFKQLGIQYKIEENRFILDLKNWYL